MSATLPGGRALRDEPDAEAIVAAVCAITDALDPADVGRCTGEQVMAEIPELGQRDDEDLQQAILASTISAVADAWNGLRFDRPLERVTLPAETIALAHEIIRRNIDLATMLRGYRVGHAHVMRHCERAAAEIELDPDVRWRALTRISRYLFGNVDALSVRGSELFFAERARWLRGAAAARAEIVAALLAGQDLDPARAGTTLGYDLRGTHVAFVLWLDAPRSTASGTSQLETCGGPFARLLGGGPVLLIRAGARALWGWTSGAGLTELPGCGPAVLPTGVRAAVGTPREGVAGFARSHREALAARRAAALMGCSRIVGYRSAALASLLTRDPAAAVEFVESELGTLAGDAGTMRRLRATLRVYLEELASPARTARRLGIHHNTVVYRVHQAEEMLGRPAKERRLELEIALQLADSIEALRGAEE